MALLSNNSKISRVLDFKIENGEQMYFVKFEPIWIQAKQLDEKAVEPFWEGVHRGYDIMSKSYATKISPLPLKRDSEGNTAASNLETSLAFGNALLETFQPLMASPQKNDAASSESPQVIAKTPTKGRGRGRGKKIVTFQSAVQVANANPIVANPLVPQNSPHSIYASPQKNGCLQIGVISPTKAEVKAEENATPSKQKVKSPNGKSPTVRSPKKEITAESWENLYVNICYYCRFCEKPCENLQKRSVKTHYESHFPLKNVGCYQCEMRFRTKTEVKNHVVKEHQSQYVAEHVVQFHDKIAVPFIPIDEHGENIYVSPYVSHSFKCKVCACDLPRNAENQWKEHFESHSVTQ